MMHGMNIKKDEDKFKEFNKMKFRFHGTSLLAVKCYIPTANVIKITDAARTRATIKIVVCGCRSFRKNI
jgi:hypothetical protein